MKYLYIISYRISTTDITREGDGAHKREERLSKIIDFLNKTSQTPNSILKDDTTSMLYALSSRDIDYIQTGLESIAHIDDTLTIIQVCRENKCFRKITQVIIINPKDVYPSDIQNML